MPARLRTQLATIAVLIAVIGIAACTGGSARGGGKELFDEGKTLLLAGKYPEAITIFERYGDEHPKGNLASRAVLNLGKAHLALGDRDAAAAAFDDCIARFGDTIEGGKARSKRALVALFRGEVDDAKARFAKVAATPSDALAPEAKAFVAFLEARGDRLKD